MLTPGGIEDGEDLCRMAEEELMGGQRKDSGLGKAGMIRLVAGNDRIGSRYGRIGGKGGACGRGSACW